jgi:hypothetical protein
LLGTKGYVVVVDDDDDSQFKAPVTRELPLMFSLHFTGYWEWWEAIHPFFKIFNQCLYVTLPIWFREKGF